MVVNKNNQNRITWEWLVQQYSYNPESGEFRRRKSGRLIGKRNKAGYLVLSCAGTYFYQHRLAWFYVHGVWPKHQIDHADGKKDNNAIANLREATDRQNRANTKPYKNNKSGLKGAYWYPPTQKWVARISDGNKTIPLGYYNTAEEAHAAYMMAAKAKFGEFARAS